jgi:hypothetical protein
MRLNFYKINLPFSSIHCQWECDATKSPSFNNIFLHNQNTPWHNLWDEQNPKFTYSNGGNNPSSTWERPFANGNFKMVLEGLGFLNYHLFNWIFSSFHACHDIRSMSCHRMNIFLLISWCQIYWCQLLKYSKFSKYHGNRCLWFFFSWSHMYKFSILNGYMYHLFLVMCSIFHGSKGIISWC